MSADYDVIIVGGGPAGSCAAIHLASSGARVLLAERERFPREKLCGEFISPECLAHFERLGVLGSMEAARGADVSETVFYAPTGRALSVPSEWFGGARAALGLSRAEMDARLLEGARRAGAHVVEEAALACVLVEGARVGGVSLRAPSGRLSEHSAHVTIDATGRRRAVVRLALRALGGAREATIDEAVAERDARPARAGLVAFKAHLEGARGARGACEIYFYPGGYGGLSPVEGGASNLCFIARARDVRAMDSDATRVMREVVSKNRRAAATLADAKPRGRWLAVSVESFGRHEPAPAPGLIAAGDAAAFIDPFTGSGMLMALEGGELAANAILRALGGARASTGPSFAELDALALDYRAAYDERFGARLRLCGLLRRAAFAPSPFAELSVLALGASATLRRMLARATRRAPSRAAAKRRTA
jgi:menaquinone-9 beta-reductase